MQHHASVGCRVARIAARRSGFTDAMSFASRCSRRVEGIRPADASAEVPPPFMREPGLDDSGPMTPSPAPRPPIRLLGRRGASTRFRNGRRDRLWSSARMRFPNSFARCARTTTVGSIQASVRAGTGSVSSSAFRRIRSLRRLSNTVSGRWRRRKPSVKRSNWTKTILSAAKLQSESSRLYSRRGSNDLSWLRFDLPDGFELRRSCSAQ